MKATDTGSVPRGFREWLFQDWVVNQTRPDSQLLLIWFRLAQWAHLHWGIAARLIVTPYWWLSSMVVGIELPPTIEVGPRLRLYHPHSIVLNPHTTLGADCHLRHGVTVGNRTDRAGNELGIATIGSSVDLGAGCAVIGDLHVGDHARVGALAVVTKPVPAWAVVAGNPSVVIRIEKPDAIEDGPITSTLRATL
jgi:putative colanic acid biosynthesis acetyltransferase WcaB